MKLAKYLIIIAAVTPLVGFGGQQKEAPAAPAAPAAQTAEMPAPQWSCQDTLKIVNKADEREVNWNGTYWYIKSSGKEFMVFATDPKAQNLDKILDPAIETNGGKGNDNTKAPGLHIGLLSNNPNVNDCVYTLELPNQITQHVFLKNKNSL